MSDVNETGNQEQVVTSSGSVDFKSTLPEDLREDPSLQAIKSVADLAKSYVNAQGLIGRSIRIPSEEAGNEHREEFYKKLESIPGIVRIPEEENDKAWDGFYAKLGRPDKPDSYQYELPKNIPVDTAELGGWNNLAYELGLNKKQAQAIVEFETDRYLKQVASFDNARSAAEKELRNKWGKDYDSRLQGAKVAAHHYAEKYPDAMARMVYGEMGNNPVLIEVLSDVAENLQEKGVINPGSALHYGVSSQQALEEINDIRRNREHPYHDPLKPGHIEARQKMQKLYQLAYPDS